jgi:prepilin-type N-terminal cleavage/methylation domain-containing protein
VTSFASRQRGLTLLEMLLALAAGALLLSAALPMLNLTMSAATTAATTDQMDVDRQAAFAIERISAIVRATPPVILAAQDSSTSGAWFKPSTFQLSGTQLVEQRDPDPAPHVLADSVTAFSITNLPVSDGRQLVQVSLTLEPSNSTASTTVTSVMRMGWTQ